MTSSWQVLTRRSTADWARSGSAIRASHSAGSRLEAEVVDDQQWDVGEAAHLGVDGVVEPGGFEPFEQLVGAGHVHADAAAHGDVPQCGGQVGLAYSDRAEQQGAVRAVEEAQRDQFVPQVLVEADRGAGIPGVQPHAGVQAGGAGAQRGGVGVAS